jgi:predicted nucleotidyltransferase
MAAVTDEAIEVLERFLVLLKTTPIRIERAVLFGSYARGYAHEWSDIDVALVSPDFSGVRFYDRKMLNPFMLNVDTRIETHPFRPEDFTEEDPFVEEIMRTGVELHV